MAAGGHQQATLDVTGTFSAAALGIKSQLIGLRVFVEDYLPERPRVYSSTYLLKVLDAHQHALWMTEQLNLWHRRALEVRDRELQLYDTNQQLREIPPHQLGQADTRQRIKNQATAERANTGMNSRRPPDAVPSPPGCCTEWVASKITGAPVPRMIARLRMSEIRLL